MVGLSQELAQQLKFPTGTDGYDNRTSYIYIERVREERESTPTFFKAVYKH